MPAYVLAIYDVVNQKGYEPYVPAVRKIRLESTASGFVCLAKQFVPPPR